MTYAVATAMAAAIAFYPARRCPGPFRTAVWLSCSVVVALSPCFVPLQSGPLRLAASLLAIGLLVKLYDLRVRPRCSLDMRFGWYVTYLGNFFWLVLRRDPGRVSRASDLRSLITMAPACLLSALWVAALWTQDWSAVPFALEHALKVVSVVSAVVYLTNAAAVAFRLLGGRAFTPMSKPIAAETPADFWRRWNLPAQHFFNQYAFLPAGGSRNAAAATLFTFCVSGLVHEYVFGIASGRIQGWQLLFFLLQGCAVASTRRVRPKGWARAIWLAATLTFNLSTSVLFFRSVDAVFPFYWHPGH